MISGFFQIGWIRTTGVLLLALSAVEVFVRTDLFYELTPDSQAQEPIEIFELGFSLFADPEFIVLGNSLTRDAISSSETSRLADTDKDFLLNLSQSAAEMSDHLWLYHRYRHKIKQADTLLIGIDIRSFDDTFSFNSGTSPRFRRYASLSQRLAVTDRSERISLLAGSVWKTWDARQQIRGYITDVLRLRFGRSGQPDIDELGRFAVRRQASSTDAEDIAARASTDYSFARGVQFDAFSQLIDLAEQDSLNVILLEAPATKVYLDQLDRNVGDEIDKLYRAIEGETGRKVLRIAPNSGDCPRIEDCFVDYGHMNARGSKIFTRLLLEHLGIPSRLEIPRGFQFDSPT